MKVYKVSPIVKYSPFFTLTYVSSFDFEIANLVKVDFNRREIFAIVLEKYNLKDAKVEIRKADFQTKKIGKRLEESVEKMFDIGEVERFVDFSNEFFIPVGEILHYIYGEDFTPQQGRGINPPDGTGEIFPVPSGGELVIFPDDLSLKINKKNSAESLVKGAEIFKNLLNGQFETLKIKDYNFDKYLNFQSPHISKLDLLFLFLKNKKLSIKKIIFESDFLGLYENNWIKENIKNNKLFNKFIIEINENKNSAKKYIVKVGRDENGEEEIFAKEALVKISSNQKNFFFVLSHGYADRIFCNDCKKSYDCENCGQGYSLLNDEDGKYLYCKNCKNRKVLKEDQYVICKHCGSWRIFSFGIGGQKVLEYLNSLPQQSLPQQGRGSGEGINPPAEHGVVLIDESIQKLSAKKIIENVRDFLNGEENILIGSLRTLKVLQNHVREKKVKSFVISTGPIIRGKNFDSDEKLLKLISEIENISTEMYINKREGDEISLDNYKDKNKFIKEELILREELKLPPFSKVLSLIFDYRVKSALDKYLQSLPEKNILKNFFEIKKGNKFIYYWFTPQQGRGSGGRGSEEGKLLRQFGDLIVANSIIEQSVLKK